MPVAATSRPRVAASRRGAKTSRQPRVGEDRWCRFVDRFSQPSGRRERRPSQRRWPAAATSTREVLPRAREVQPIPRQVRGPSRCLDHAAACRPYFARRASAFADAGARPEALKNVVVPSGSRTSARRSPPSAQLCGYATVSTPAAASAASMALPPALPAASPASVASRSGVARATQRRAAQSRHDSESRGAQNPATQQRRSFHST